MPAPQLRIALFGRLNINREPGVGHVLEAHKLQELFCYLLLYRERLHPREVLADRFWNDFSSSQARTHLRKALWEIQSALGGPSPGLNERVLLIDPEAVQVNQRANFWLDIAEFEQVFHQVKDRPGEQIDDLAAKQLQAAVELYRGDLLDGWYHDWCLYERERLQQIFLSMLDKLMGYCEIHHYYEQGIDYGVSILRYDRAQEQTHCRLMRLHFLAGDRTGALRQYERCASALHEELAIAPSEATLALYEQIRANRLEHRAAYPHAMRSPAALPDQLCNVLAHLNQFQAELELFRQQVASEIASLSETLNGPR